MEDSILLFMGYTLPIKYWQDLPIWQVNFIGKKLIKSRHLQCLIVYYSTIMKDPLIRRVVQKFEMRRLIYKNLTCALDGQTQAFVQWKYNELPKASGKTQIQNRCVLTNRSKGVSKYFRISRHCLRELASAGLLPGVQKSSW